MIIPLRMDYDIYNSLHALYSCHEILESYNMWANLIIDSFMCELVCSHFWTGWKHIRKLFLLVLVSKSKVWPDYDYRKFIKQIFWSWTLLVQLRCSVYTSTSVKALTSLKFNSSFLLHKLKHTQCIYLWLRWLVSV